MPQHFIIPPTPPLTGAMDLFPELEGEIGRRIAHAEQRIKNWVLVGILTNFLVVAMAGIPSVFFLGQLSRDASDALVQIKANRDELDRRRIWMGRRDLWESSAEQWMISRGWRPPNPRDQ